MMLDVIRKKIVAKKGKTFRFKFNGTRNQADEFRGEICDLYSTVFTIRVDDSTHMLRTFTYSDVLTNTLEILEK